MIKNAALLLLALTSFAASADEGFLPGRIESRSKARTILAKCMVRDAIKSANCVGFRFYYSETGNEADAKPISNSIYTMEGLEALKTKPVVFNLFDGLAGANRNVTDDGLYTIGVVSFLNDYEDSWGESTFARIAYATGRGVLYGTMVPVAAALDVSGIAIASPYTLVQVIANSARNGKIRKLSRALESGKKIPMDINRVYRLRDML